MGEWLMPNPAVLLSDVLGSPAFGVPPAQQARLVVALSETGFLVSTAYYVPDAKELFDLYRQLSEVDYHGRGRIKRSWLRWVMCGETQIALQQKYLVMTTRAAASLPAAIDAGRLFDMPIRRDPAARRPLWELIPKDERA